VLRGRGYATEAAGAALGWLAEVLPGELRRLVRRGSSAVIDDSASIAVSGNHWRCAVATLTVRGVSEEAKAALRVEAAQHGRSMEAELRARIEEWFGRRPAQTGLGTELHERFTEALGGDLETAREFADAMEWVQSLRRESMPREIDFENVE
jgi:plasmid stability protein